MDIESLLRDLIKIESITPKDEGCFDLIEPFLIDLGFKCERIDYDNVENLYAVLGNNGPLMCFLGHTDVVPTGPVENWTQAPFSAVTIDGHMYGRGTADMKGNIAAYLLALKDFLSTNPTLNYRLAVLLTSNEEGEPEDGKIDVIIKKFMDDGEHIDFCLVGEPSSNKKVGDTIRIGRRGSLSGTLKVLGKQGHVAYPEKVENPIFTSAKLISELESITWDEGNEHFQPTSFQISNIKSGTGATNVVPGVLEMMFNFRFCSESNEAYLKETFEAVLKKLDLKYEVEWVLSGLPYLTEKKYFIEQIVDSVKSITGYEPIINNGGGTSDGRFLQVMGSEIVELGPLNETIHKTDENVSLQDLETLKGIYSNLLERLNSN
jgi:succinyl-diaminopimelate desuccinylase